MYVLAVLHADPRRWALGNREIDPTYELLPRAIGTGLASTTCRSRALPAVLLLLLLLLLLLATGGRGS